MKPTIPSLLPRETILSNRIIAKQLGQAAGLSDDHTARLLRVQEFDVYCERQRPYWINNSFDSFIGPLGKINIKENDADLLGAEFLSWAVICHSARGEDLAMRLLPKAYRNNKELIAFFTSKLKARSLDLLQSYHESSANLIGNTQDNLFLYKAVRRGLHTDKGKVGLLTFYNDQPFALLSNDVNPAKFWEEEESFPNVHVSSVLTDCAIEFWQTNRYIRERNKKPNLAEEIREFNDANVAHIKEGSETTDLKVEIERMEKTIDYLIASGHLPKPDPQNPVEIVIVDFGIGFLRKHGPRLDDLRRRGYNPKVIGIDVSEEVVKFHRENKTGVDIRQVLFSEAALQDGLYRVADELVCDWGSMQHANKVIELVASLIAANLVTKQNGTVSLNFALDAGDIRQKLRDRLADNMQRGNVTADGQLMEFSYDEKGKKIDVFIPHVKQLFKMVKDAGIVLFPENKGLPPREYSVGERKRIDIVGSVRPITETDNIVSLLIALERFGGLAFPGMVENKFQDAA